MAIGPPPHSTLYASSNHGEPVNCKDVRKLLWILGSEISAMGSIETSVEAIAAAVRISYGPCGKDQLIVTERQKLVTNSAARILELARPGSPIAKVVLRHICKFAQDVGDGAGTLALLLAGAVRVCSSWLREGKARRQDLEHCLSYIEAVVLREDAAEVLQGLRCSGDTSTEKRFSDLARTFFGANFPPEVCGVLSRACWRWICDNYSLPLDGDKAAVTEKVVASAAASLRSGELVKVPSAGPSMQEAAGSASSARVERAVVVCGVLASSSMPRECQGRAVILDDDVAPLPVRVAMPAVALDRLEKRLVVATEQLWQAGIRLVLCAAHVHEEWTGSLSQRGIAVLHLVDEEELAVLEARCGITRRVRLGSDDVASLKAAGFQLESFRPLQKSSEGLAGSRAYWLLDLSPQSNRTPASCLLLQASSSSLAIEHRLAVLRLLLVVLHGFQEPCDLIAGGLAFEVALLRMARRKITNLRGPEDRNLERNAFHLLGVDDPAKALRLEGLSWLLLEASLLEVVEAFIANLLGCRGGAGARLRSAGRTARLLASAGASELDDVPGMLAMPGGFYGFVVEPGIGACEDSTPRPVETAHLKLQQLRAMCSLVRQLCRLDPSCVDRGRYYHDNSRADNFDSESPTSSSPAEVTLVADLHFRCWDPESGRTPPSNVWLSCNRRFCSKHGGLAASELATQNRHICGLSDVTSMLNRSFRDFMRLPSSALFVRPLPRQRPEALSGRDRGRWPLPKVRVCKRSSPSNHFRFQVSCARANGHLVMVQDDRFHHI
eukprot:s1345_g7.t1